MRALLVLTSIRFTVSTARAIPYRQIGVFTADGSGHITGGSDDSSVNAAGTAVTGSYNVANDGTGFINLNTSLGQISWAITLSSTSKLSLIEADSFANAGGTAELQSASAISATPGTFVFQIHQEISAQNQGPAAEVGSIALSGGSGTGSMDENLSGVFSSPNLTATVSAAATLGRGTGAIVNSTTNLTMNFVYYAVSSTRFVMLVSNVGAVGSGSAELQSGAVGNGLSGNYAFGSRGDDGNAGLAGRATVGQFNAASGTMTGSLDFNQDGTTTSCPTFSSTYTPSPSGRVVVSTASGNSCPATQPLVFWMVSPSRAFFVNNNATSVEDGTADLQTSQNFSAATFTQQYSIAMDGLDLSNFAQLGEQLLSRVGTLQFDGTGKLTLNEVCQFNGVRTGGSQPGNPDRHLFCELEWASGWNPERGQPEPGDVCGFRIAGLRAAERPRPHNVRNSSAAAMIRRSGLFRSVLGRTRRVQNRQDW